MTTIQFNTALRSLRLSVYAAAPVLGISLRQAQRYSSGEQEVSLPVANYLNAMVGMVRGWKARRLELQKGIAWFKDTGAKIYADNRDMTRSHLAQQEVWLREIEDLLRDPLNGLPPQIDD